MTGGRLGPRRRERQHWSSTGEGLRSAAPVAKLPPSGFVHASCAAPTGRAGLLRGTATSSDRISAGFGGFWDDCRSAHGCWVSETLETLQLQAVSYQRDGEKVFVSASVSPLSVSLQLPVAFGFWKRHPQAPGGLALWPPLARLLVTVGKVVSIPSARVT